MDGDEARTARSSAARTARRSQWAHTDVFSDEEAGDDDAKTRGGRTARTAAAAASKAGGPRAEAAARSRAGTERGGGRLPGSGAGQDPLDLLDAGELGFQGFRVRAPSPLHRILV